MAFGKVLLLVALFGAAIAIVIFYDRGEEVGQESSSYKLREGLPFTDRDLYESYGDDEYLLVSTSDGWRSMEQTGVKQNPQQTLYKEDNSDTIEVRLDLPLDHSPARPPQFDAPNLVTVYADHYLYQVDLVSGKYQKGARVGTSGEVIRDVTLGGGYWFWTSDDGLLEKPQHYFHFMHERYLLAGKPLQMLFRGLSVYVITTKGALCEFTIHEGSVSLSRVHVEEGDDELVVEKDASFVDVSPDGLELMVSEKDRTTLYRRKDQREYFKADKRWAIKGGLVKYDTDTFYVISHVKPSRLYHYVGDLVMNYVPIETSGYCRNAGRRMLIGNRWWHVEDQ